MSAEVPFDPRAGRFRSLSRGMNVAMVTAAMAAVIGVVAPDPLGFAAGVTMVAVLVAAPLVRVGWFVLRWFRRGDPRFAVVGLGVIVISAAGAGLALL
jgi:hypothetical protein